MNASQTPSPTRRGQIIAALAGLMVTAGLLVGAVVGVERHLAAKAEHEIYEQPASRRAIRLKEHNPNTDGLRRPNADYLARSHDLPDIEYRLRTDADGFIEPGGPPAFRNNRDLLIAFLGGSTTECLYVPEESRFPAVVRGLFVKDGVRADALNGGVSGNNVMHSVDTLVNKVLGHKPDYVVLMHDWNDLGYLMNYGDYWSVTDPLKSLVMENYAAPTGFDIKTAFKHYLPYTFNLVKTAWQRVEADSEDGSGGAMTPPRRIGGDTKLRLERQFEAALTTFIQVTRAWGAQPVLMTQAAFLPPGGEIAERYKYLLWITQDRRFAYEDFVEMHARFNDVIRQVAGRFDVPLVDLAQRLSEQDYIYDPVHLNEKGSKLAGQLIYAKIKELYDGAQAVKSSKRSAAPAIGPGMAAVGTGARAAAPSGPAPAGQRESSSPGTQ